MVIKYRVYISFWEDHDSNQAAIPHEATGCITTSALVAAMPGDLQTGVA